MADHDDPGAGASRPTGWRAAFILLLLTLYAILSYAAFALHSAFLQPLINVPPNRFVDLSGLLVVAIRVTGLFAMFWWAFALGGGGLALLTWRGTLDGLIKPLTALALLLCVAAGALVGYIHWIPAGVERSHGPEIRHRLFGAPVPK